MARENCQFDTSPVFRSVSLLSQFKIEIHGWPQVVVLGQQNEGKSSVLESIIQLGILPKCQGLCTRKPMYFTLINYHEVRIIIGNITYNEIQAAEELNHLNMDPNVDRINCTIMSPYVYNCTIVDTIGLIHVSDEDNKLNPKKIKQQTIEYLKDENNIFVLVSSATSDPANSQMLNLIRRYKRINDTLGVLTKIDLVENQNQNTINDLLSGKNYKLGYGWIPTKLRSDRELQNGMTIEQSIIQENEYCSQRFFSNFPHGIPEIRKTISFIQFEKIKTNIPLIIQEIDNKIILLHKSQSYLQRIIDESDYTLAQKLKPMIEKLVGSSIDRCQFEISLENNIKEYLLDHMNKNLNISDNQKFDLNDYQSSSTIDLNIYNFHVQNKTVAEHLVINEDLHKMLNSGLISPIVLNNETLSQAYQYEANIASLLPIFELKTDDPMGEKRAAWNAYLEKYFSTLQNSNTLQNKIYEITEKMLVDYINSTNDDELSHSFTEYMVSNIGQITFEEKIRYSITSLVNIEQRPYIETYNVLKQIIAGNDSSYLDYDQFYTIRRKIWFRPNINKLSITLHSEIWNRAYLVCVINRLSLNCFRIVAVNLLDKMVVNLLREVINLNKEKSQTENRIIGDKITLLSQIKSNLSQLI